MKETGLFIKDERVKFQITKDSIRIMLAQISPAYDPEVFAKDCLVRIRDPDRQAEKILKIIKHACSTDIDLLLFPELVAPFSHMAAFEDAIRNVRRNMVVCLPYEHTPAQDFISLLSEDEIKDYGFVDTQKGTRTVNFCRIVMHVRSEVRVFTQVKLTPFSVEFSLSTKDTLMCGRTVHRFVTNWGNFLFLICKDYVGEIGVQKKTPMFDFLKSLAKKGLHYVFVSSLNPEPDAFIYAARSFYYMQEKSNYTFTLFLNVAELNNTAIVFPTRPHPKIRPSKDMVMLNLFEGKPGWGTHLRFPGCKERLITGTFARLDQYKPLPTKEIFSPVYHTAIHELQELGIESELPAPQEIAFRGKIPLKPLHNLPLQPTPFVGREGELAEIAKLLEKPSCRLITLLGPGGMGKTRLALQIAAEKIGEFPHGVCFIPLASLSSSDFLVSTIAKFLEFSFRGPRDPKIQLINYLREKNILLIMDSFEHLLEGANFLTEILESAPGVLILVTSRERLNLQGEWIAEVHGMKFPVSDKVEDIESFDAVELFSQSAQKLSPGFSLLDEEKPDAIRICQLVEGVPLAIELAGAWRHVLSCSEIAEEIRNNIDFLATSMRDVPERHRSMRAVFEHSWNLLSQEERDVFMELSIFRGGFRREAAEKVAGASLHILLSLVNKSLLRWNPSERYEVHELPRQYAEEKLNEVSQEREKVHDLHCGFYAEFLNRRRELLRGENQRETLEEIDEEIENVRAAWLWAVERGKQEIINTCLDILWRFYMVRGWHQDGEEMFGKAVEKLEKGLEEVEDERKLVLGRVLKRQGVFSYRLGRYEKAREILEKSLHLFCKLDAQKEIADTLNELGHVSYIQGDPLKGKQLLEESLSICGKIGHRKGMASPYTTLGNISLRLGELKEARQYYQKSFAIYKEMKDQWAMATLLMNLGIIAVELGEYAEAKRLYEESLIRSRELGDRRGIASILNNMGNIAKELGEYVQAKKLYQESMHLKIEIGDRKGMANSLGNLGNIAFALGDYDEAKQCHQKALTLCKEIGFRWGMVSALIGLGNDLCNSGKARESKKYFYEALSIAMEISAVPLILDVLVGIASLSTTEKERALELLSFVLRHTGSYIHTKNRAEQLRSELSAQLDAHVVKEIEERSKTRELDEVIKGILEEKD